MPWAVNLAEVLAERSYEQYRQRFEGCPCPNCKEEILRLALNQISPHYVSSEFALESDLADRRLVTEVVTALMRAIVYVKSHPKH
jgi:hypothetical protein